MAFLGITVHWISKNWKLKEILIDFYKLFKLYSEENLAKAFMNYTNNLNILNKILAIITDSASNNNTLMNTLETIY
ncbi:hypothetical protein C1645_833799 [Glomus cerebriforme]|uniref:Uncharacterized protein n=1 Tax=Glomus cerebriforme TaxID=658196 RepID=A0A397SLK5_9GLOM|nr:hypothetical protein C1645_833799 [Glomus cerebriforme]